MYGTTAAARTKRHAPDNDRVPNDKTVWRAHARARWNQIATVAMCRGQARNTDRRILFYGSNRVGLDALYRVVGVVFVVFVAAAEHNGESIHVSYGRPHNISSTFFIVF